MLTEDPELDTEALLSSKAITTPPARQPRIEDHLGTLFDAIDPFSDLVDDAGSVGTTNVRQPDRNARYAVSTKRSR